MLKSFSTLSSSILQKTTYGQVPAPIAESWWIQYNTIKREKKDLPSVGLNCDIDGIVVIKADMVISFARDHHVYEENFTVRKSAEGEI